MVSVAIVNQVITIRSVAYPTRDGPHLEEEGNIPRSVQNSLSRAHARHSYDDSISHPLSVDPPFDIHDFFCCESMKSNLTPRRAEQSISRAASRDYRSIAIFVILLVLSLLIAANIVQETCCGMRETGAVMIASKIFLRAR